MAQQPSSVYQERRRQHDRRQRKLRVAVERRGGRDRREILAAMSDAERQAVDSQDFCRSLEQYCLFTRYPTCRDVLLVAHSLGYRKVPAAK
jgi:hypothetical protein